MRKTQRRYRHASKILESQIMKFHNASISELQRKDVINTATNHGKHKASDAIIYKLILDTLKEAKPFRNIAPLGKQLERASIESGYHNSKGKWISTFYVTTNLPKIDFDGLGVEHQTHDERMGMRNELKKHNTEYIPRISNQKARELGRSYTSKQSD
tara:strand:+ start:773 stop:1243 length:471 start_codon:yes stop_codon:yes gene_type:complete